MPPMPAFYHRPATVEDIVAQTVGKILDQLGIDDPEAARWDGPPRPSN